MKRGSTALVTGASAGIGKAFAEQLGAAGVDLVLVARRRDRLEQVAGEIAKSAGVRTDVIVADLAEPAAPEQILRELGSRSVDVLINNAGYGIPERYTEVPWTRHAEFVQVMVTAMAHLTHLVLPGMLERRYGRIAQVASIAGLAPGAPTNTLYAASKAFLVRFTESLSAELDGTGVHVTAVCPGFTRSEFHEVMGTRATMSQVPEIAWQSSEDVAREGLAALERGDAVYVTGRLNRFITSALRHLPQQLVRNVMRQPR
jgi:short-subunit dehydrogenase